MTDLIISICVTVLCVGVWAWWTWTAIANLKAQISDCTIKQKAITEHFDKQAQKKPSSYKKKRYYKPKKAAGTSKSS